MEEEEEEEEGAADRWLEFTSIAVASTLSLASFLLTVFLEVSEDPPPRMPPPPPSDRPRLRGEGAGGDIGPRRRQRGDSIAPTSLPPPVSVRGVHLLT